MPPEVRRAFLLAAAVVTVLAVAWASFFESTPQAEFSFQNGTDPKTLDPHRATGQPESRLIFNIFHGLLQMLPEGEPDPSNGLQPMAPGPAVAESYTVSDDGLTYTFKLRGDAVWNDGVAITSQDFVWSWTRMLHPETACEYTFLLHSVPFARQYGSATVSIGDRVEVELWDRPGEGPGSDPNIQNFPRGTIHYGTLTEIIKPPQPTIAEDTDQDRRNEILGDWQRQWVYVVRRAPLDSTGRVNWDEVVATQSYVADPRSSVSRKDTQQVHNVLVAFDKLGGIEAPDAKTFIVHLEDPLPYFPNLVAYYPTFPLPRHCIEKHGMPLWTKPENIVTNGPYAVGFRRLRDRVRLVKNARYFDAEQVSIKTIDAMSTESGNTALNMYETGQIQWVYDPPNAFIQLLGQRDDFLSAPQLSVYFYRINTTRPPMNNVLVRRAVSMAIDRQQIVDQVTKAGQIPAFSLVPPGIAGYESPPNFGFDLDEAKRLLSEAGHPRGKGLPKITLLYNTHEDHRAIAEVIQQQLQNNLNIKIELQNMEWGSYLDKVTQLDYDVARAGWIADYPDPNTFLDLWLTNGPQNNTGWSSKAFDDLLGQAAAESDPKKRMELLASAERIWIDEVPVIPLYFYVSKNLIRPEIRGFAPTPQDIHPFHLLSIEPPPQGEPVGATR